MTDQPDTAWLREQLGKQSRQLDDEEWARRFATVVAFAAGLIFLPAWIVLPLAAYNVTSELICSRILRDPDVLVTSARHRAGFAAFMFAFEASFIIPGAIMWHLDDPFAKSLAVGLAASALMHLAMVRSIHLAQGQSAAAALSIIVLGSNSAYWIMRDDWLALMISTIFVLTVLGYFLSAMVANHNLHRDSAAGHRAASEAVAAKDRLLATISHELRTPLNGIVGMGHAELAEASSPEARARLSVLVASAEGLSAILNDILDISAARDGRLAIRPGVWVPADEIAAAVLLFRRETEAKGVTMTLDMSPNLSQPAAFDRQRLRQCLSNLLSNSLRHGKGAAVRIYATRTHGPHDRPLLDLCVADDGPGVPEALRAILFEPFTRLHDPTPEGARQGHGLGLSIARSLARQMGGDLVLEEPGPQGRGAVFRLTLELAPAPANALGDRSALPDGLPPVAARVLVVDDIATNRLVAISCLHLAGAEALAVDSGAAALDRLAAGGFDAICLDMNMPGLDGLATLARIRALDGPAARVAVIAMTADTGEARQAFYLAAGCDGYLAKPITPDSAGAVLASVLSARRSGAA